MSDEEKTVKKDDYTSCKKCGSDNTEDIWANSPDYFGEKYRCLDCGEIGEAILV